MRRLALLAIRLYQRYLSPYKGFRCAYRAHAGRASCSALGYRAVRRHGVFTGLGLIRARTRRCSVLHRQRAVASSWPRQPAGQRGFCDCDLPCDGCDGMDIDYLDCCSSCDWPSRRQSPRRDDRRR